MKNNYRPDFTYQDFASEFTAEFYNPDDWADLFHGWSKILLLFFPMIMLVKFERFDLLFPFEKKNAKDVVTRLGVAISVVIWLSGESVRLESCRLGFHSE